MSQQIVMRRDLSSSRQVGNLRSLWLFPLFLAFASWACTLSEEPLPVSATVRPAVEQSPAVNPTARSTADPSPPADEAVPPDGNPLPPIVGQAPLPYDQEVLTYWHTRYPLSTTRIFEEAFVPVFSPEERRILVDTPLVFPLRGEGPFEDNPLAYYAGGDPQTVFMPILSLKFLDDLSTAYAWLQLNGYSLETVTDYMAMLKYNPPQSFRSEQYPTPLQALGVPEDALQDPEVDDLALRLFNSARAFILAHELGHVYHGHSGYQGLTAQEAQRNETDADLFALEMMRRTATIPMGAYLFFLLQAHWDPNMADFQSTQEWQDHLSTATHPLTADRMRTLAQTLRDSADSFARNDPNYEASFDTIVSIADKLLEIADILEDTDVQQSIAFKGLATDPAFLAPRRPGQLPCDSFSADQNLQQDPSLPFQGIYRGSYDHFVQGSSADEEVPMCIVLQRIGEGVKGNFSFGLGEGSLIGILQGDELHFTWNWGQESGRGVFLALEQGEAFSGTWGYVESRHGAGAWRGRRQ